MGPENRMPDLVDVVIEAPVWAAHDLAHLAEVAARATLDHLGLDAARFEIALLGCDDARMAALNSDFRGKASPTNVLSWPAHDLSAPQPGTRPSPPPDAGGTVAAELGDIAIALQTCQREAAAQTKPFQDHVSHLLVHGCLHLLGYDHISAKDAALMEGLEVEILAKLGIANPY